MSNPRFINTNPNCAICLEPLSIRQTLTLTCGHVYHLSCLISQLRHTQPTPSKRLLFSGARCAQCQAPFNHPLLQDYTRPYVSIGTKVNDLIRQQVRIDGVPAQVTDVIEYGKRVYSFYICFNCGDPYFGGRVDCGDGAETELHGNERFCFKCSPQTVAVCKNGAHWPSYSWKCRFCCKKATFVCYGGVHFCDDCHYRDGQRRARREQVLKAIPCKGAPACELGGLQAGERHKNGSGLDCELLLSCAICDTSGDNGEAEVPAGSGNFLRNSSGEEGTRGWKNIGLWPWIVEAAPRESMGPALNFVSGYRMCCMVQIVDLARFILNPAEREVEVSAKYRGWTELSSVFRMVCLVLDQFGKVVQQWDSGDLHAPLHGWKMLRHVFGPHPRRRLVAVGVCGVDRRNNWWYNTHGSGVADITARLLFEGSSDGVLRDPVPPISFYEGYFMESICRRLSWTRNS